MIENQPEATDHGHLGQILMYAGNRKAGVIVRISPTFRDEHRQALGWLNKVSEDDIEFFGLQLELLQIGGSAPAPIIEIVARPKAWKKAGPKPNKMTPRQQAYREFFEALPWEASN